MYFSKFPKALYSFDYVNQSPKIITNLLARVRMKMNIVDNAVVFYKYQLEDGDTPEIVASKVYGDPEYHWVIILVNNLSDPIFDFPLDTNSLENMIIKKYEYSSIANAYSEIHHWLKQTQKTLVEVNGPTTVNTENNIISLQQYSYLSNSLTTVNTSSTITLPVIDGAFNASNTIYFRANNSDNTSTVVATLQVKDSFKPVYVYDYEFIENEKKREIKILKREYIQPLIAELDKLLVG